MSIVNVLKISNLDGTIMGFNKNMEKSISI